MLRSSKAISGTKPQFRYSFRTSTDRRPSLLRGSLCGPRSFALDEPEILPSSTHPICLMSADGGDLEGAV
jgi:hypothetical protein